MRGKHPNATVARTYAETFGKMVRAGFSRADARDRAEAEAERVRRETRRDR